MSGSRSDNLLRGTSPMRSPSPVREPTPTEELRGMSVEPADGVRPERPAGVAPTLHLALDNVVRALGARGG